MQTNNLWNGGPMEQMNMQDATMNNNKENVLLPLPGNNITLRGSPRLMRSPPQPSMCVQVTLMEADAPCFINIMSWQKINLPTRQEDPIPLYGAVKVPLSDRCILPAYVSNCHEKPLVFAVAVNPEVLQNVGKNSENPKERAVLVEMILEFVEAMNPGVKLSSEFTVLKDRELMGELKDMWVAIQAKHDAEKSCFKDVQCQQMYENWEPAVNNTCPSQVIAKRQRSEEPEEGWHLPVQSQVINREDGSLSTEEDKDW